MKLAEIEQELVTPLMKGIPDEAAPFPLEEMGEQGWNVLREDLHLPLAVLRNSALVHNSKWMSRFLQHSDALLVPHGKTTMSPQLFQRQLADGAWGITVATVDQLKVCRRYGLNRVILANQLVGRRSIKYVLDELERDPDFDFYCLVDSVEGVQQLAGAAAARELQRPVQVLLEGGFPGGRTGCRDLRGALSVARAAKESEPHLTLRGVEGFEGLIPGETAEEVERRVGVFLSFLANIAREVERQELFGSGMLLISAGGSAFYDMVVERFGSLRLSRKFRVVTRSGCYLTHDSRMYKEAFRHIERRSPRVRELGAGLLPALEVWSYVQSRPEPSRAILTMGKRDCSFDAGLPVPEKWFRPGNHTAPRPLDDGSTIIALNDQHAFMEIPASSDLRVGDMVGSGISHPCTTFDRWQLLPVIDDDYNVLSGVRTYF